jgi:hypothetical protein
LGLWRRARPGQGIPSKAARSAPILWIAVVALALRESSGCGPRCMLRPAPKRCSARRGQGVDSPLDGVEPPIDVAAQDLRSVWYVRPKVPGTSRALRQRGGASEGALTIRRHNRLPRPSAFNRIPPPAAMFLDETGSAAGILARHRRSGTHQHLNLAIRPHSEHAETKPSAKVAKPRVVFTPLRRKASGEPTSSHAVARSTPAKRARG